MARIILSIFFLIVFTIIIVMNLGNTTAFNLFGFRFSELPSTAVAIVSFVLGVLYSFIYYLFSFFGRKKKEQIQRKKKNLIERETSLKDREKSVEEKLKQNEKSQDDAGDGNHDTGNIDKARQGIFRKAVSRRKK